MPRNHHLSLFFFFFVLVSGCTAATPEKNSINMLFYNFENLFDTQDDPSVNDEEFLPESEKHWTRSRFREKINRLSKVILASSGHEPPQIIGCCEIENRFVLEELTRRSALQKWDYQIIHKDSPDPRGIDVALLYRGACKPIAYAYYPLTDLNGKPIGTREILHASFLLQKNDTLHVLVMHWPSRSGGQTETEPKRVVAAQKAKQLVDSIQQKNKEAKIVLMGDLNDTPTDKSIAQTLRAKQADSPKTKGELVNISARWKGQGTVKYKQNWDIFDQFIVSDVLLKKQKWSVDQKASKVLDFDFLLEEDTRYPGKKPFRTYLGPNYHGGFSDHLPVLLKLVY